MNNGLSRYRYVMWVLSIILSLIVRMPGLFSSSYWWRAHQTEITTYWFEKEGIDLLNYQTPIYGPPWQIPFEFPLFQATAALISKIGISNIGLACRIAALLYFYLTAAILFLLCEEIFGKNATTFIITSLFLWLPYNIYFSTEPLIDYLALAIVLAYFYFIGLWLKSGNQSINGILAIVSGSLAILVKPTTYPIMGIPIIAFIIKDMLLKFRSESTNKPTFEVFLRSVLTRLDYWFALAVILLIPLVLASLWTRHADAIKNASVFTQWLTSKELQGWNFATWELRLDREVWIRYWSTGQRWLLPYGLQGFWLLGLCAALGIVRVVNRTNNNDVNLFVGAVAISLLLTFGIFLNLYQHTYYFIAWTASMCIVSGYGIISAWNYVVSRHYIFKYLFAFYALIFIVSNIRDYQFFLNVLNQNDMMWKKASAWAQQVQGYIPENEWAIIVDYDWSPTYPYLLERKAMVYSPKDEGKPICEMAEHQNFTLVVLADPVYKDNLLRVLSCFRSNTEVMPNIYKVEP